MIYSNVSENSESLIEMTEGHDTSLRDLCSILFRNKYKMAAFVIVAVAGTAILTFSAPKIYQSEAKLLVRLGRESVSLDPTTTTGQIVPVVKSLESEVLAELEILRSPRIVEKVVDSMGPEAIVGGPVEPPPGGESERESNDHIIGQTLDAAKSRMRQLAQRIGLDEPINDHDKAVLTLMENTSVTAEKDSSNIIRIYFWANQPELAQQVVEELIEAYMEERVSIYATIGSYEFFVEQCRLLQNQLDESEQQLEAAAGDSGASSVDEELKVTLERIGSLDTQIDLTDSSMAAAQARVQKLGETLATLPETVVTSTTTGFPNVAADAMRERLYELQLQEQDMASKYSEQSRQVRDIRRQIEEAQTLLQEETPIRAQTTTALNDARQQTEAALLTEKARLSALEAETGALRQRLNEARAHLTSLNSTAAEIRRLTREIKLQEVNYHRYAESLEQVRIDHALDAERISNITVVQPATLAPKPVRPRMALQLTLGLLFGVFGALVLAFACEYLDHTIRTPREVVQKLRLPVLTYVPRVRAHRVRPLRAPKRSLLLHEPDRPWDIPSSVRDHFGALAQKIMSATNGSRRSRPRLIALTGSRRGEGVSTVAANLATALAREADVNVLLIDANFASPSLHKAFHVQANSGLAHILSDGNGQNDADAIVQSPVEKLEILPAGSGNGDSQKGFRPTGWTSLLKRLKKDYRHVIVDLPALHEVKWSALAASLCDGVVLVVEANESPCEAALEAKQQLAQGKAKILGVVLNKRRFPVPRWLYNAL